MQPDGVIAELRVQGPGIFSRVALAARVFWRAEARADDTSFNEIPLLCLFASGKPDFASFHWTTLRRKRQCATSDGVAA